MKLLSAPRDGTSPRFQVRVPQELAAVARWRAASLGIDASSFAYSCVLAHLPAVEAYEHGHVCPDMSGKRLTSILIRVDLDTFRRLNVQAGRGYRWNRSRTELVPGGSRDALIALCMSKALEGVILPDTPNPGRARHVNQHILVPVPQELAQWLHSRHPGAVSAFVRRALAEQLSHVRADERIKRGSMAPPPGAHWPTLSVKIGPDAWDEADRIASAKDMPRVQVLRAAIVRAVIEAAQHEKAQREAERARSLAQV